MKEGVLEKIIVVERPLEMASSSLSHNGLVVENPSSTWHVSVLTERLHVEF